MKTIREQLTGECRHFNGVPRHFQGEWENKTCKAGVNYHKLMRITELGDAGCLCRIPCTGDVPGTQVRTQTVEPCEKYDPMTEAEIQQEEREIQERMEEIRRDISPCCKAPIDHSRSITDGEYKGHGPHYCSKCKRLVYMV